MTTTTKRAIDWQADADALFAIGVQHMTQFTTALSDGVPVVSVAPGAAIVSAITELAEFAQQRAKVERANECRICEGRTTVRVKDEFGSMTVNGPCPNVAVHTV